MKTASAVFGSMVLSTAAVAQQYTISTVAGGAPPPSPSAALSTSLGSGYTSVATDGAGNVYVLDFNCVLKVDTNGVLTVIAVNGRAGYSGDGGPATSAQFGSISDLAADSPGISMLRIQSTIEFERSQQVESLRLWQATG